MAKRGWITAAALGLSLGLVGIASAQTDGDTNQPPAANTQDQTNPPTQQQQPNPSRGDASDVVNQSGHDTNTQGSIDLDSLKPDEVTQLQTKLAAKGFYTGKIDGHAGPLTKTALSQFQKSQGLSVGDKIDPQTASALGVTFSEFQPVRGTSTGTDEYGGVPANEGSGNQGAIQNQRGEDPCKTLTSPDEVDCKAGSQTTNPNGASQPGGQR